jgi:hypothetical protein
MFKNMARRVPGKAGNHPKKMGVLQSTDDILTAAAISKKQSA